MRQVRVPLPTSAWEMRCEGPFCPTAPSFTVAQARLDNALAALPRLDIALGEEGWTVVWRSAVLESGPLLAVWLWCARPERAADLVRAVAARLEAAGFAVRPTPRPVRVDAALEPRVVYLRAGAVRLGQEPRTAGLLADLDVVAEPRDDVDLGLTFRFGSQRCPACGVEDAPAALVAGFPSPDLLLAVELGEVALADGGLVDRRSRKNARCRRCGVDFIAR
jgi:hypothetical protein